VCRDNARQRCSKVAVVLLLSIFTKVGKMLAGLSSYRLRTQCFKHVVCRAVAGGVLPCFFGHHIGAGYLKKQSIRRTRTHSSHIVGGKCM